jgi:Sigma-70, region 4/Sigma-70 region 2
MANIDSFQPGTNMSAWLFTILRNLFCSEYRKRRREVEDTDGTYAESLKSHPEQHSRVEFDEFRAALAKLPPDQREALILVGASGFSYEEAAAISTARSARSRAGSIARARGCRTFSPSRVRMTSARIMPPALFCRRLREPDPDSCVGLMRMLAVAKCWRMPILRSEFEPDFAVGLF